MILFVSVAATADDPAPIRAVKMDDEKLAGVNLPEYEPFFSPKQLIGGNHKPRGEPLFYGEELIVEVYEDEPLTVDYPASAPFPHDEFILVLSGKLILTGSDGVVQDFVAGESVTLPRGFSGTWEHQGNYRELIVINREAYEAEYGAPE